MKKKYYALLALFAMLWSGWLSATPDLLPVSCAGTPVTVTTTYGGAAPGPVDGRTINGAAYSGPGTVTSAPGAAFQNLSGRFVSGRDNEPLTLDFPVAVNRIEYSFAVDTRLPVGPVATIRLYDEAGALINVFTAGAAVPAGLSNAEGRMAVAGANIRRAVLEFGGLGVDQYAFDNLRVEYASPAIVAADETLTVPYCSATVDMIYSFQLLGCSGFDPASIQAVISPVPPAYTPNLRFASEEGGSYLYEFSANVTPGDYTLTIDDGPGGLDPLVANIRVNASNNPNPILSWSPLTVTIPSCAESISVIGALTIISCDDEIDPARLRVRDNRTNQFLQASYVNANGNFREYTFPVGQGDVDADPETNYFEISYVDEFGNSQVIYPGLVARQTNAFDAPPTIVYPANEIVLTLDPCEETLRYTFSATAVDECDGDITPVVTLAPDEKLGISPFGLTPSGDGNEYTFDYPPGSHRVFVTARDRAGNERIENFNLVVNQDPARAPNIACNSLIHVTLEDDCGKVVTPDMVTEGNFGTCFPYREQDFRVIVYDGVYEDDKGKPADPNEIVEKAGTFNYVVMWGPNSDEYCWGKIKVEDKTPPVVTCPDDVIGLVKTAASGGEAELTVDGAGYKYRPGVAADVSCDENDTRCNNACDDKTPNFNYLVCTDIDKIMNVSRSWTDEKYAYFTGKATAYDCSAIEFVGVKDVLTEYDCDANYVVRYGQAVSSVLTRTFTYKDKDNNVASCTQKIYFFRPEVRLPACKTELDQCLFPDLTAANSMTRIDPLATKTAPFFYNGACEKIYLNDHVCNLTVTFNDEVLPGPEQCGLKIIRTWTFLDWCWKEDACDLFHEPEGCGAHLSNWNGKKRTYEQHIIVGDKIPPTLDLPTVKVGNALTTRQVFSAGPFNCTAVVNPLPPVVKNNECKGWSWEFELYGTVVDPKTGIAKPNQLIVASSGQVAYGVQTGSYTLRYVVADRCGNKATIDVPVEVGDKIAPVAICNDQLNVSIGGANTTAEGLARVTAADVDEGSWDNCELTALHVSREIEADCLADAYAPYVNGLSWPGDYDKLTGPAPYAFVYVAKKDALARNVRKGDTLIAEKTDGSFYSWWANEVYFTCCDISTDAADRLKVELRAADAAGNTNICWQEVLIEDKLPPRCEVSHNKEVLCTELEFSIQDVTSNPSLLHPRYGAPEQVVKVLDNCGAEISEAVSYTPGNCGTGVITRTFTITDNNNRTAVCLQKITILEVNDYDIKFPGDLASVECGAALREDIQVSTDACDILAVNRDTARFEAEGQSDVCFKMLVTYKVINWCEYDGEALQPTVIPRDVDEDGKLDESTHLEARYETAKFLNDNYRLCSGSWPADGAFVVKVFAETKTSSGQYVRNALPTKILVRATCPSNPSLHAGYLVYRYDAGQGCYVVYCQDERSVASICANLTYKGSCWTPGYYEYTQIVKVYDNTAPTLTLETTNMTFCAYGTPDVDCDAQVDFLVTVDDECTPDLATVQTVRLIVNDVGNPQNLTGQMYRVTQIPGSSTYQISGRMPVGRHTFIVSATDGCGNPNALRVPFTVEDCKSPAPICIQTLSVDLMPVDANNDGRVDGGMNTVWARDFIASPIDDCSPFDIPENVKYFVFKAGDLPGGPLSVTIDSLTDEHTSVVYTCDEVNGAVTTYVFALDAAGNFDYCTVLAFVRPGISPSPCGGGGGGENVNGQIAGLISTEEVSAVAGVDVQLSGQATMKYLTNDNGDYAFQGLIEGYDYSVTPYLDKEYMNGVSTFDLILISKHILGVKRLDSPYKMIAADVNDSRSITTLDLIALRKLILGVDARFTNNRSWRFVPSGHRFPDPANPWAAPFPEVLNVNDLAGAMQGDFMAIKIGDVNASARANALQSVEVRDVAGAFTIATEELLLRSGEEYRVTVTSGQLAAIQGFQGTLTLDLGKVELAGMEYGLAKEENVGIFAEQGLITMSWNHSDFRLPTSDLPLFSLVLRARSDTRLSQVLGISSRLTPAEAYDLDGRTLDVALAFRDAAGREQGGAGFRLYQNVPNPFRDQTVVGFDLPAAAEATLKIQDVTGRTLRVIRGDFAEGYNEVRLDRHTLPAGVLSYTLESGSFKATNKMILAQ